jgi:hypothetical protein
MVVCVAGMAACVWHHVNALWSEASSSPRGLERGVSGSEHGNVATMPWWLSKKIYKIQFCIIFVKLYFLSVT